MGEKKWTHSEKFAYCVEVKPQDLRNNDRYKTATTAAHTHTHTKKKTVRVCVSVQSTTKYYIVAG